MLFEFLYSINADGLFLPTKFDPLVSKSTNSVQLKEIFENKFDVQSATPEFHKPSPSKIGELSLISFNAYTDRLSKEDRMAFRDSFKKLVNGSHASVIGIQSISKNLMDIFNGDIRSHYQMINMEKSDIDRKTNRRMYLPIFYDRTLLALEKKGFFSRNDKSTTPFASYALFRYNALRFAVVNMDIYEQEEKKANLLFFKILSDLTGSGFVGPVFLLGYISLATEDILQTISDKYNNLIEKDRNNQKLSLTTVHGGNENDDNIQRDYILLKDDQNVFRLNYSRILSQLKIGQHYPIHVMVTQNSTIQQQKYYKAQMKRSKAVRSSK